MRADVDDRTRQSVEFLARIEALEEAVAVLSAPAG